MKSKDIIKDAHRLLGDEMPDYFDTPEGIRVAKVVAKRLADQIDLEILNSILNGTKPEPIIKA